MKRALILFCVFCLTSIVPSPVQADDNVKDGVFVHISHGSDDPHRLLMALNMARVGVPISPVEITVFPAIALVNLALVVVLLRNVKETGG